MSTAMAAIASIAAGFAASSAMVAAPAQSRPGEPTQAKVWIQNRGINEAVPISIQAIGNVSLPVMVAGTPTVALASGTQVQTRRASQPWEYRTVTVRSDADPVEALRAAGGEGWETSGLQFPTAGGTLVLLKRPR